MQIEVKAISRQFGKTVALDAVSFRLPPGSITGFVGPNGAGKSTAMRIMAGRDLPDSGDVLYDGLSVVEYPEKLAAAIGYMPDSLPESTDWAVAEYLDFFARAARLQGQARIDRLNHVIHFTRLDELCEKTLSDLSKGMKQRVSLARVLLADPAVLLLDEPAAGLDPRARVELRESILHLAATGKTILISSHILSELEDLCDNMLILEKGRLLRSGSLAELETVGAELRLTLEFLAVDDALTAAVDALPHCAECSAVTRRQLAVRIAGGDAEFDEFMAALFQRHLPVTGFARGGRTLESIFMQSTTGEVQ